MADMEYVVRSKDDRLLVCGNADETGNVELLTVMYGDMAPFPHLLPGQTYRMAFTKVEDDFTFGPKGD